MQNCDTHFFPPDAFDYVPDDFVGLVPRLTFDEAGSLIDIQFPGRPEDVPGATPLPAPGSGARHLGMVNMERRLEEYDRLGIGQQFLLPQFTGWWSYLIEPALGTAMAHSWNIAALRQLRAYPERLIGVALVALQDAAGAIQELEWAHSQGFKAAVVDKVFPVREHCYGTPLGVHDHLRPFFKTAERLEMPLYLHAVQHGHRIVNLPTYRQHGLEVFAPSEGELTVASLITSGILDECPRLQIIVAEMGTAHIGPLAELLDAAHRASRLRYEDDEAANAQSRTIASAETDAAAAARLAREKNQHPPSHYLRENFSWTIETEEPELPEAMALMGPERFLFATDYPHEDPGGKMKYRDVEILAANTVISEPDKELLRSGNAARLFGI